MLVLPTVLCLRWLLAAENYLTVRESARVRAFVIIYHILKVC